MMTNFKMNLIFHQTKHSLCTPSSTSHPPWNPGIQQPQIPWPPTLIRLTRHRSSRTLSKLWNPRWPTF